jgi:signal transduction histidine kinase
MTDIHRRVVAGVDAALLLLDRRGRILLCNTPAIRLLGRDLAGQSLAEGDFDDDLPLVAAVASRYRLASALPETSGELIASTGDDGPRFHWMQLGSGAADSSGEPGERILMMVDVTALLSSAASVRTVFSQVNHDLRSPLTSIGGAAELLLSGRVGDLDAMQKRLVGIVEESVGRIARILARTKARLADRQTAGAEERA